jgi:hypothetical protein
MDFEKVLSNFSRNLPIRHFVYGFNPNDAPTEIVVLKTFFQFTLRLARTKDQQSFGLPNTRNDRIVVNVEMSRECSLAVIICWYLL